MYKTLPSNAIVAEIGVDRGHNSLAINRLCTPKELYLIIDTSLKRFDKIWSAAGHTHCVFAATFEQLSKMTTAIESDEVT